MVEEIEFLRRQANLFVAAQHDHGRLDAAPPQVAQQGHAVLRAKAVIEERQIERAGIERGERLAVRSHDRDRRIRAAVGETDELRHHLRMLPLIVDDEQAERV